MNRPSYFKDYFTETSPNHENERLSYTADLEKYCDELERINKKLNDKVYMLSGEHFINPCEGCRDYCYKNDECKSNGGCVRIKEFKYE